MSTNGTAAAAAPAAKPSASSISDSAPLSTEEVREVQSRLKSLGFDAGPIDGLSGP